MKIGQNFLDSSSHQARNDVDPKQGKSSALNFVASIVDQLSVVKHTKAACGDSDMRLKINGSPCVVRHRSNPPLENDLRNMRAEAACSERVEGDVPSMRNAGGPEKPGAVRLGHHAKAGVKKMWAALRPLLDASVSGLYTLAQTYPGTATLGKPVDFERLGLRSEEAAVFLDLAVEKKWHIFVRTGTFARTANVGRPGLRAKPAGVYQKTSKDSAHPGLVLYKADELEKAARDLAAIHHPDPQHSSASIKTLSKEGLHLKALGDDVFAICDQADNEFFGDVDTHGVYSPQPDGSTAKIPAEIFVPLFNERLVATGLHGPHLLADGTVMTEKEFGVLPYSPIQHGAHDEWDERNNTEYAGGINMGPLPGVIHFSPDAAPCYIATTPQYQDILWSLGRSAEYNGEALSNGRNRPKDTFYIPKKEV